MKKKEALTGILFASPWIIGFIFFLGGPLIRSFRNSFTDYTTLNPPVWIGGDNFSNLMKDELFWSSMVATITYSAVAVPCMTVTAIALAMLLNSKVAGLPWFRTMFFLPSLIPAVPMAILFQWLYSGDNGLINGVLNQVGIESVNWLSDPTASKAVLITMAIWTVGNPMVIYLAGLQQIPKQYYEASDLDGASAWKKTLNVTIPLLSPVIMFNVVMGLISSLQIFTQPYIIFPGGAPDRANYFYSVYIFDTAFRDLRMGYASAMGWVMFLVILVLTLIALKLFQKRVHYEGA